MSISLEQATNCLVRGGLSSDTELAEARTALNQAGKPLEAGQLIGELVARGGLTSFQAQEILGGRGFELKLRNYLILSEIGQGGMGRVYKALHKRMNRVVALKLLRKEFTDSPELTGRFQQEAHAAARLNHPNVVAAYDADECELGHFLVMEYVEGCDLGRSVMCTGPLPVAEAVEAVRQSALGLGYAHSQGVIHRDVKPANLLRDVGGVVKLADLGLARLALGSQSDGTGDRWVAGTLDYMSPEQSIDTNAVDQRSDIYSLGHTLYFLLTARPAFDDPTANQRILAHRTRPAPSLCSAREEVGEQVDAIFQKMVAKRPQDRYQSMEEVARDLGALQGGPGGLQWEPAATTYLVVEESRLLIGLVRRFLGDLGADDIHMASSGQQALNALEKLPADVILTGMQLPDMTGLELAQRLRHDLPWKRSAIAIMTSEPTRGLLEGVRRLARVSLLVKPFHGGGLKQAVNEAFTSNAVACAKFASMSDKQVLIVDDSSVARRRMQSVLSDLGFVCFSEATDGTEGLAILNRKRIDLVVTDYNMPGMDGQEMVAHIRQHSSQSTVPVILCTSEFDPAKLAPMYQLGVSAICNKSFDPELVRNLVVRLFK